MTALATRDAARTGEVQSFTTVPTAAFAAAAAGSLLGRLPGARALRLAGGAVLAAALGLALDVARGETVPGASDNATGVAGVLWLVERLARDPLPDTEVVVLLSGCEEAGMGGMAAWLRAEGRRLDPASTLVLGLDTLGAGEPVVLRGEGPPRAVRYREEDLAWADHGAERAGVAPPRRFRIGGYTDPVLALLAGLPAISLLSVDPERGVFTNYHLPTDTPENVRWGSVDACLALAEGIVRAWGER